MSNTENAVFDSEVDWKPLDNVIRGWVAMDGFEKDQENYEKRKNMYQD